MSPRNRNLRDEPDADHTETAAITERSRWPKFAIPSLRERQAIAELERMPEPVIADLVMRRLIWTADFEEGRGWVFSGESLIEQCATARLLSGRAWSGAPDSSRSKFLPGSDINHPVGLSHASWIVHPSRRLALTPSVNTALACMNIMWVAGCSADVALVVISGKEPVQADDLDNFRGRPTLVYSSNDAEREAADTWKRQLQNVTIVERRIL